MPSRSAVRAFALAFVLATAIGLSCAQAPALAAVSPAPSGTAVTTDPLDSDGDAIPDAVERVVCGSVTCARTGADGNGNGITDVVEIPPCGSRRCTDPRGDGDGDGIPDFVERFVCGTATCSNGREDADHDGVPDWVEFVVCGTAACATGEEDLDRDGVADAAALQAYAVYRRNLVPTRPATDRTPVAVWWGGGILVLLAAGVVVGRARRRAESAVAAAAGSPVCDIARASAAAESADPPLETPRGVTAPGRPRPAPCPDAARATAPDAGSHPG